MTIKDLKYGDRFKLTEEGSIIYKVIRVHDTNVTVTDQFGMVDVLSKSRECSKEDENHVDC